MQPMHSYTYGYTVCCVPLLPGISIFLNIFLCLWLSTYAWIRLAIWCLIGIVVYIVCAIKYNRTRPNIFERRKPYGLDGGLVNNGFINDNETVYSTTVSTERSIFAKEMKENDVSMDDETLVVVAKYQTSLSENDDEIEKCTAIVLADGDRQRSLENIEHTVQQKAQTPSPTASLDDIFLCSDIENSLTEKREPNGKTYFIDGNTTKSDVDEQTMIDDMDQNRAIALLDDVLNTEESAEKSRKSSMDDGKKSAVIAVIHLPSSGDESENEDDNKESNEAKTQIDEQVEQHKYNTNKSVSVSLNSEANNYMDTEQNRKSTGGEIIEAINHMETENVEDRPSDEITHPGIANKERVEQDDNDNGIQTIDIPEMANQIDENTSSLTFKDRLAMLLGQQSQTIRKFNETISVDAKSPKSGMTHAKSEPDIMKLVFDDIRARQVDIDVDKENEDSGGSMTLPRAQHSANAGETAAIPPAPKFDPIVYKTIGSKVNPRKSPIRPTLSNAMSLDRAAVGVQQKSKVNAPETDDVHDEKDRMVTIRNKLENILKRGPPNRYSRPPSVPPSPIPMEATPPLERNEEVFSFKEANKPYDTVHKQKLLFDDVLKSMNSESRPSLIRATSPKPTSGAP